MLAALLAGAFALRSAKPDVSSEEFRKEFIEKFQRTGLNTTPGDAMMLRILVESRGAKRGIEVGAASGFGAINMGIGFERTGGHLYSLEIDPRRAEESRQNIRKVGLEKTVTIKSQGLGGRNQEFALAGALDIAGLEKVVLLSGGTDGTDGPTDAAGAIADHTTVERAHSMGLNPGAHLKNNNAYPFFKGLGDLLMTGPTHTNVMDVQVLLVS